MNVRILTDELTEKYLRSLVLDEKSYITIQKYRHDITVFQEYLGGRELKKELVIEYKNKLLKDGYAVSSINSMISAINSMFAFLGWGDLKIRFLKYQRQLFIPEEKELSRDEYVRLVTTASEDGEDRLAMMLQTICATGIRVSELSFITVEAAKRGRAVVRCKSKSRTVFIVDLLSRKLLSYAKARGIKSGPVFITAGGKPIDRTRIWREMKKLCEKADVNPKKVFPHNLRHLFARVFYAMKNDIAKLADVLGHSSINTTRIYVASTGNQHIEELKNMRLLI